MTSLRREDLIRALPYARRYARALSGSQPAGDALVADALRTLLAQEGPAAHADPRHALYHLVTLLSDAAPAVPDREEDKAGLSRKQRQLLLLTSLEEVPTEAAGPIAGLSPAEAEAQLGTARDRLRSAVSTDVLIIEDEPIIAMDVEELVAGCGHRVVGVAATEQEAVDLARETRPGLILADINLGSGGDGTAAVARILKNHYAPVIFVTAYPERLLTGEATEPAFVITKPFEPMTLAIATYQAVGRAAGMGLDLDAADAEGDGAGPFAGTPVSARRSTQA